MIELNKIYNSDCFELIKQIPDESIDLVLTDPPYGLKFMGKSWDSTDGKFYEDFGKSIYPKLKAGSFVVFTMTPRQDMLWRCLSGFEKAGFLLKTSPLFWLYHSGFPKAMDISKMIDKKKGLKGKIVGDLPNHRLTSSSFELGFRAGKGDGKLRMPESNEAKEWIGWKSFQLKPAVEIIIVVQKPIEKKTIVEQILENGHGAINVEETRIPYANQNDINSQERANSPKSTRINGAGGAFSGNVYGDPSQGFSKKFETGEGRFPANLIVSGEPLKGEESQSVDNIRNNKIGSNIYGGGKGFPPISGTGYNDFGSPNRFYSLDRWAEKNNITLTENDSAFFDVPKPSNSEKEENTEGIQSKTPKIYGSGLGTSLEHENNPKSNFHPTVKPLLLFQYLLKMFSRQDWVVLDPFMGSGTTPIACYRLNRKFIGIEKEKEYFEIANKRINEELKQKKILSESEIRM